MDNRKTLRLVKKAMRGDDKAFLELMKIKQKDLLYIAIQIMRNKQDGEDAAQETALIIREKIRGLRSADAFTVWMYKIVHTTCMNMKRNMKLSTIDIDMIEKQEFPQEDRQEFLPAEYALNKELRERVLESLNQLPEKQRTCILLFYYEGLKYHEIAEILDINVQDVANSLGRGKKKLKELLAVDDYSSEISTKHQVGSLAVVTLVLRNDADTVVTSAMCQAFEGKLAATSIAAGGAASSLAMTKAATAVIVGLTVVAGGVTAYSTMSEDGALVQQASQEEFAAPTTLDGEAEVSTQKGISESIATLTLPEDVSNSSSKEETIGDVYDRFIESEQSEDDWNDLVVTVNAQYYSHIVGVQYRFDVYRVSLAADQQPLVVIARINDGGHVDLAMQQMNEQDIPRQKDIVRAFEEWRK